MKQYLLPFMSGQHRRSWKFFFQSSAFSSLHHGVIIINFLLYLIGGENKLRVLDLGRNFQSSKIFANKTTAYSSGAPYNAKQYGQAPGISHKH